MADRLNDQAKELLRQRAKIQDPINDGDDIIAAFITAYDQILDEAYANVDQNKYHKATMAELSTITDNNAGDLRLIQAIDELLVKKFHEYKQCPDSKRFHAFKGDLIAISNSLTARGQALQDRPASPAPAL